MKCKKVISLITTLAMCISMFSAFSVTSFAENDNTYSCDFTSLVKDNADTTYGTADDIYDIDDYTKAVLTYAGTYVSADGKDSRTDKRRFLWWNRPRANTRTCSAIV